MTPPTVVVSDPDMVVSNPDIEQCSSSLQEETRIEGTFVWPYISHFKFNAELLIRRLGLVLRPLRSVDY